MSLRRSTFMGQSPPSELIVFVFWDDELPRVYRTVWSFFVYKKDGSVIGQHQGACLNMGFLV